MLFALPSGEAECVKRWIVGKWTPWFRFRPADPFRVFIVQLFSQNQPLFAALIVTRHMNK